jgi:hypothetical protein
MAKLKTVTEIATCTKPSWTNRQRAQFHAFNPNGMVAEYANLCATIEGMVGMFNLPVHGFDSEYQLMLYKMCTEKAVKRGDLMIAMRGLDRRIKQAQAFIAESQATA